MDTTSRRPTLPALNFVDTRNEESSQSRQAGPSAPSHVGSKPSSETAYHFADPSSRVTSLQPMAGTANAWSRDNSQFQNAPESRRSSGEEKLGGKMAVRQSLPSLSEIMGRDRSDSFSKKAPSPSGLPASQTQHNKSTRPSPASPAAPSITASGTAAYPPYAVQRTDSGVQSSLPPIQTQQAAYSSVEEPRTSAAAPGGRSTSHVPALPRPQERSPAHESAQAAHGTHPMPPPGYAYSQAHYPYRRDEPSQRPGGLGPIYQPSVVHNAPHTWKSENGDYSPMQRHDAHKDTVKRHLDSQNLEYALNEISHTSGIVLDFARRYGDQMYATSRTTSSLTHLPSIVEVDDMAAKTKVQLDQLLSIREHVFNQQQAIYDYQAADQHASRVGAAEKHRMPVEHSPYDTDDKNSFQGDSKKPRRGRAAPPGRCHSCNRAETPEWRRGPDGARTLCNACGLHYAKLTRKNNSGSGGSTNGSNANSNNKQVAAMVGSNLRPKDPMAP